MKGADAPSIHRILTRDEWARARREGSIRPNAADQRDGFMHLSTRAQLQDTLRMHFPNATDLVIVTLAADALAPGLRWEIVEARGGALFPHYHGDGIPLEGVVHVDPDEGSAPP